MNVTRRYDLWRLATMTLGIVCYYVAIERLLVGVLCLALAATGRLLVANDDGRALPRWLLNVIVLGATSFAVAQALASPENTVEYIGTLLTWVQVVKLYDRQTPRDHAQLLVMSVFTAIAACLMSNSLPVGVVLAVYMPMALWTIVLHQTASAARRVRLTNPDATIGAFDRAALRRLRAAVFCFGLVGALGATMIYFSLPRGVGSEMFSEWSSPRAGATSGFTDEVVLGRPGEITESQETALDVAIFDESGRNIGSVDRSLLLRGATLEVYDAQRGVWRRADDAAERVSAVLAGPTSSLMLDPNPGAQRYIQRITIRNKQMEHLFTLSRPVLVSFDRETNVRHRQRDHVLTSPRTGRVSYIVESVLDVRPDAALLTERLEPMMRTGRIHDYTVELLAREDIERDPERRFTAEDRRIARLVERHLQTTFEYDTVLPAPQNGEDPLEMFLFRARRGHCEYFASAMAAMLRSVGVDARVVTGYRASEFNEYAGLYTVRQSNAHAWVEAQVAPGLWMTFDPSPPEFVGVNIAAQSDLIARLRRMYDAAEHAWVMWVVGFDEQKRMTVLGVEQLRNSALGERLFEWAFLSRDDLIRRAVRSALYGVAAFSAVLLLGAAWKFGRVRLRVGRYGRASRRAAGAFDPVAARRLAFYNRLLRALAEAGMPKPEWRAPLHHAQAIGAADPALAGSVERLVLLYYKDRFGGDALRDDEIAAADRALDDVHARLRERRSRRA